MNTLSVNPKPIPEINAHSKPYWDGAQRGELMIQRCRGTGRAFMYARCWSPFDFSPDPVWEKASGLGTVFSFTVVYQPPYAAFKTECPFVIAVIELEEGPRMMSNILHCNPESVRIGMQVKLCFETRGDGFRIPQFEPA